MTYSIQQSLLLASFLLLAGLGALPVLANDEPNGSPRTRTSFDAGWYFSKGDPEGAEKSSFDHSAWRALDLPHDWSIEGPYDKDNPSGASGGYLPSGIGWYRKTFVVPPRSDDKMVAIEFDGIYRNGEVWINGHRLGMRPFGYLGFEYDLTPYLDREGENLIAVRVDNSQQPGSRWYTGSGIYRHVWLKVTDRLRVAHWGTQVTTPSISEKEATVRIQSTLKNDHGSGRKVNVSQSILDSNGKSLVSVSQSIEVAKGAEKVLDQTLKLPKPELWSPDSPSLYTVRTEIHLDGELTDRYMSPLGIREVVFDPKRGVILNGKEIIMKGVCNHHDLGPLGAALWDDAIERRLRMLKEMGCNAIRTAHNPSSSELLKLCDELGFLVVNETFDEWRRGWAFEDGKLVASKENKGKARFGYNRIFDDWAERDLTDHVRRDRNHPSVIMWSVGNEVPEAQKHGELETLKWLRKLCHSLDPSRPMTVGCNFIAGANESGFTELMDLVGYNGGGGSCFQYEEDHLRYPERFIYASEVPHSLQTRGEYRTRSKYREPKHQPPHLTEKELFQETHPRYESSYDNAGVRISARDSWRLTKTLPYVGGEFRWTGFDYLGESGGWPRVLGNFGIIDLCNFPKDTYYFYQSQWTDEAMVHLLPHWTWPGRDGVSIPVWCYTNCDSVELFLNDESLGRREFTEKNDMHLEWLVPYEKGRLKAVAVRDGKVVATSEVVTAGAPARVSLSVDQSALDAGCNDLSYVTIRIEDEDGNFVPKAATSVNLELEGPGRLVAVGNGDPLSHQSFQGDAITTFNGLALAILTSTEGAGDITLKASAEGLPTQEVTITVKASGDVGTGVSTTNGMLNNPE
ncbi:glycoside hydrolase family 2 TIM barrel-domain containing protein [Haloferula sp.]|uniref:glycoside hydrolase family 2 TIM barrel-domain containing protein n=1 Tax=Haloferula sp. TaxID=2497595 RepID=UPI00329CA31D